MSLNSQTVEFAGGLINNAFYDLKTEDPHYSSSYTGGLGFTALIGIEEIKVDWLKLNFTLSYDRYTGKLEAREGGLGGSSTTKADIDKSLISLGVFPLNFKFITKINLNLGFEISKLITEKIEGTKGEWLMGQGSIYSDLNEIYDRYSSSGYFGLRFRLSYDLKIADRFLLSPQYSYYLGLSKEFVGFPQQTKSVRHYFCLGIKMKLE